MWHCRKDDLDPPTARRNTSRIYGRGFYDDQLKALESMNNARLLSIEQGLNGCARKLRQLQRLLKSIGQGEA